MGGVSVCEYLYIPLTLPHTPLHTHIPHTIDCIAHTRSPLHTHPPHSLVPRLLFRRARKMRSGNETTLHTHPSTHAPPHSSLYTHPSHSPFHTPHTPHRRYLPHLVRLFSHLERVSSPPFSLTDTRASEMRVERSSLTVSGIELQAYQYYASVESGWSNIV